MQLRPELESDIVDRDHTTEAELRFLASHAAANDAVYKEVPEETVRKLGVFEVQTKCANKNEMLLRPDWGRIFYRRHRKQFPKTVYIIHRCRFILETVFVHRP